VPFDRGLLAQVRLAQVRLGRVLSGRVLSAPAALMPPMVRAAGFELVPPMLPALMSSPTRPAAQR
jgi:hypothetical protein